MPRRPKIKVKPLKGGKWGYDTMATGTRQRPTFDTIEEAERAAEQLKRQCAGTGLNANRLRGYEAADHRLETTDAPGKGKDIVFVVDWFLEHYVGANSSKTIAEWATDYIAAKKLVVEDKTLREIQQYLTDCFAVEFGHLTPIDVGHSQIEAHLAAHTSRWHRDKVLRNFFLWLSGAECRSMATLPNAPLKSSPFRHIVKLPYERLNDEVEVLYIAELRAAIELAIKEYPEALGVLVFNVLTGLRPDCEAPKFWTGEKHGWRKIDFNRKLLTVTKELEKTGKRGRQLALRPNVVAWLEYFKSKDTPMTCTRYAWRKFKKAAFPTKANVQDLLRHTAISNYAKVLSVVELEFQFATSKDMVMEHYLAMISDEDVEAFFSLTPASFGLSM